MKTLLKMAAYFAITACTSGILAVLAWGISYGVTGEPTFHDNMLLVMVGFYGSVLLGIVAFILLMTKPWES